MVGKHVFTIIYSTDGIYFQIKNINHSTLLAKPSQWSLITIRLERVKVYLEKARVDCFTSIVGGIVDVDNILFMLDCLPGSSN